MTDKINNPEPYDVAVIGGGVTGLYCTWKLAGLGKKVVLYEGSKRCGGKLITKEMGNFLAEFGAMRFESVGQKRLMGLIRSLELKVTPFPKWQSSSAVWPQYNISAEEARWSNPLDLFLMGILKILGCYRDGMSKDDMLEAVSQFNEERYPDMRENLNFKNIPLYSRGLWNTLSDVLSHQAVLKIRDTGNFFHMLGENPNAIEWIIFWLRGLQKSDALVGIEGGSEQLTKTLETRIDTDQVRHRPEICLEHTLKSLSQEGEYIRLDLEYRQRQLCAQAAHVILALPKRPLDKLSQCFTSEIRDHLDGVRGVPLLKCFFVFNRPWWNEDILLHTGSESMPVREIHYSLERVTRLESQARDGLYRGEIPDVLRDTFARLGRSSDELNVLQRKDETSPAKGWWLGPRKEDPRYFIRDEDLCLFDRKGQGMVLVYTDRPGTEYWAPYMQGRSADHPEMNMSLGLRRRFIKYFSKLLPSAHEHRDINTTVLDELDGRVVASGILDWGLDPHGGAFHIWRPGVKSWKVIEALKAFDLERGSGKRLHICGEAFSDYQGFVEGALSSADLAISAIQVQASEPCD